MMLEPPSKRTERLILIIFAIGVLGLFAVDVAIDFQRRKAGALFLCLSWLPLIAVHEAGHALVARWFGCHIDRVMIGMGRELGRFRIGATRVSVRLIPIEGCVSFHSHGRSLGRWRQALIYFAGPGAELLVVAVLVLAVGPRAMVSASDSIAVLIAQSVSVAAVSSAIPNLIPHPVPVEGGYTPNDGLAIVRSLRGRPLRS